MSRHFRIVEALKSAEWNLAFALMLCVLMACGAEEKPSAAFPAGYKIWYMNPKEIYISGKDDELIVGPSLRSVGVTSQFIVAFCDFPSEGYEGKEYVGSTGYSLVDIETGVVRTGLQREDVERELAKGRGVMPNMIPYRKYPVIR